MRHILSPLNVAAGIFTIIAVLFVSNWNKKQKRAEIDKQQQEMTAYLTAHEDDILQEAQNRLPVTLKQDNMTFERIKLNEDTLEVKCRFSQLSTFYRITDGDSYCALVRMLYEGFQYKLPYLVLIKGYHVRVCTNLKGAYLDNFLVSPQAYRKAFDRCRETGIIALPWDKN